jgi:hypothetical protein
VLCFQQFKDYKPKWLTNFAALRDAFQSRTLPLVSKVISARYLDSILQLKKTFTAVHHFSKYSLKNSTVA